MAVVCSPFFWYALTGPSVQAGQGINYPADLLSFAIPTPMTWLGGKSFSAVSSAYIANTGEDGAYLGLPLIAIVIAYWSECFKRPATKVLMAVTLVAVVWSLGEVLNVDGHPTISVPFKLLAGYRLLNEVLPVRISMYTALATALAAALWVAAPGTFRWPRWLLGLLAVIFLFPNANSVNVTGQKIFDEAYRSPKFITDGLVPRLSAWWRGDPAGCVRSVRRQPSVAGAGAGFTSGSPAAGSAIGRRATRRAWSLGSCQAFTRSRTPFRSRARSSSPTVSARS